MRTHVRAWMSILIVASATAGAWAQDPPAQEGQEESPPPKLKLHEVTFGLTGYDSSFSLEQYASPITGLGLHSLRLLFPWSETSQFSRFIVRGMPDQDNYASAFWQSGNGRTMVRADRFEFGSYVLDWRARPQSSDKATSVTVDQAIAPGIGGFASFRTDKRDFHYPAPRVADLTKTQTVAAGVGGAVLGGTARISASERRTTIETGVQPTTLQRTYSATFDRDLSPNLSLGGVAAFTRIEQAGLPGSDVTSYGLNGIWDIGPDTTGLFQFSAQDLDLNPIQNAYVRRRLSSSARILHRIPGWSLQFGYRHNESERLRADQSFVDVPKTDTLDFRAAGRFGGTRVTLRGNWEDVKANAVMQTDDDRQLYWDNRAMLQARFEGGNETFAAYGTYTYRYRKNDVRNVEVDSHNIALGGSYVFDWTLSGFAEVSFDEYKAQGVAETGQSLDFYFPDSWNFAVGVDWSKDPSLVASASINYFESGDVRGAQLTLSARRSLTPDSEIELLVAPWSRDDRLLDLTGFRTTFASARYTLRF